MDSSRNFRSIPVIVFVKNLHLILLIDLERAFKNRTTHSGAFGILNKI
jgi:hypothetical protein